MKYLNRLCLLALATFAVSPINAATIVGSDSTTVTIRDGSGDAATLAQTLAAAISARLNTGSPTITYKSNSPNNPTNSTPVFIPSPLLPVIPPDNNICLKIDPSLLKPGNPCYGAGQPDPVAVANANAQFQTQLANRLLQGCNFDIVCVNSLNIDVSGSVISTTVVPSNLAVSEAPEPASWAMLILGMGTVGYAQRRRRAGGQVSYAA